MSNVKEESLNLLANTIAPEVFSIVSEDDRYISGLMNSLPSAIEGVLGKVSADTISRLGVRIMDKVTVPNTEEVESIWRARYEALFRYVKENYAESYVDGAEYYIGSLDREEY